MQVRLQVTLQYESDGWIMAATETGRAGLIPEAYLRITRGGSGPTPFSADPFGAPSAAAALPQDDPFSGGDPFSGEGWHTSHQDTII